MTIEDRVRNVIVQKLGVDPREVALAARFGDDLGAKDVVFQELNMALEEEFNLEIPDAAEAAFKTVRDAVTYITAHQQ